MVYGAFIPGVVVLNALVGMSLPMFMAPTVFGEYALASTLFQYGLIFDSKSPATVSEKRVSFFCLEKYRIGTIVELLDVRAVTLAVSAYTRFRKSGGPKKLGDRRVGKSAVVSVLNRRPDAYFKYIGNKGAGIFRIKVLDYFPHVGNQCPTYSAWCQYALYFRDKPLDLIHEEVLEHVRAIDRLETIVGKWQRLGKIHIVEALETAIAMRGVTLLGHLAQCIKGSRGQRSTRNPDVRRYIRIDPTFNRAVKCS
jgi:hypothetical protein